MRLPCHAPLKGPSRAHADSFFPAAVFAGDDEFDQAITPLKQSILRIFRLEFRTTFRERINE